MKTIVLRKIYLFASICVIALTLIAGEGFGQSNEGRSRNNPYSPSPKGKAARRDDVAPSASSKNDGSVSFVMQKSGPVSDDVARTETNRPSIAQATFKIAKAADAKALPPTEIYKIGIGDVLYVGLRNSPQGSGYFTVRPDGTIDYPLGGENVQVADQTIDTIEELLAGSITLFKEPQVEVKVRQYASHRITVSGMVENAGDKYLQREAMPLFAIRAEAVTSPKATKVSIRRGTQNAEILDLNDPQTENTLIHPGDIIEFIGDSLPIGANGSYFIGGEIASGGQKTLTSGLTLYQAIVAAGGAKGDPKKAVIRRKNDKGLFNVQEHNLRSIRSGKAIDPFLAPGDVIEIGN